MSIKRLNEFKRSSESDLIKLVIILDKLRGDRILSSSTKLRTYSKENLQSTFIEGVALKLDISRESLDNNTLSHYQKIDLENLLSELRIELTKTRNIESTLSWTKNNESAALFTLSIIRLVISNHKNSINELSFNDIENRLNTNKKTKIQFQLGGRKRETNEHHSELGMKLRKNELKAYFEIEEFNSIYYDLLDATEKYLISSKYNETSWMEKLIKECREEYSKLSSSRIESWDMSKNNNEELLSWICDNIKDKYNIQYITTPSTIKEKRLFIINNLYIISLLSDEFITKSNKGPIGNLKKLFSRKKTELNLEVKDSKGKKNILIEDEYWEKLKYISDNKSIKKTLYKIIDDAAAKVEMKASSNDSK
ncbi:hypothetical protein [Vibrio panuliri]|nr:hypothetical protein [Vibrio panuliri]